VRTVLPLMPFYFLPYYHFYEIEFTSWGQGGEIHQQPGYSDEQATYPCDV